ncbi:hypothetical protein [Ulvibacterium sp.]|uniref:hypothetical protein n=1 Tax=Ulvibacterium sp. TaxID=2665914 RepID=UPI003BA93ECC
MRIANIYFVIALLLFTCGCEKERDTTFLITQNQVGKLEKGSLARDVELIFATDSVAKDTTTLNFANKAKRIKIFEKGGKHLLTLSPSSDSIPVIENVRIEDSRYLTEKGVGIESTFKDIKEKHKIKKIITSMNNVLVLLKDSDAYFTISKEELPSSLRYASSVNIEAVQIPDAAKIKYMMIGWE